MTGFERSLFARSRFGAPIGRSETMADSGTEASGNSATVAVRVEPARARASDETSAAFVPTGPSAERTFFQERLAFFYLIAWIASSGFLVMRVVLNAVAERSARGAPLESVPGVPSRRDGDSFSRLDPRARRVVGANPSPSRRHRHDRRGLRLRRDGTDDAPHVEAGSARAPDRERGPPRPGGSRAERSAAHGLDLGDLRPPDADRRARAVSERRLGDLVPGAVVTQATLWSTFLVILATLISNVTFHLRKSVARARRLGQYTLLEKIGQGGMGVVYRAEHQMLRRPTAIKLLPPHSASEENLRRFEREAQMTARLANPHTVSVFDFGRTPEGAFYYVMEYLDGIDLERLVRETGTDAGGTRRERAPAGVRGPLRGARHRARPPRHQAREHPAFGAWRNPGFREGRRLRPRQGRARVAGRAPDAGRRLRGNASLSLAGGDSGGRFARPPQRPLRARRRGLLHADGDARLRRPRDRRDPGASRRAAATSFRTPRPAASPRSSRASSSTASRRTRTCGPRAPRSSRTASPPATTSRRGRRSRHGHGGRRARRRSRGAGACNPPAPAVFQPPRRFP